VLADAVLAIAAEKKMRTAAADRIDEGRIADSGVEGKDSVGIVETNQAQS
jgi:hypothetical protein